MSSLIRLTPKQTASTRVKSPFPLPERLTDDERDRLIVRFFDGSKDARDKLILGHVYLVLNLVGRYLHYWSQTHRFEDDMVGEGLVALIETIDAMGTIGDGDYLAHRIIYKVNYAIEKFVNENQSIVSESFAHNRENARKGRPIEIAQTVDIHPGHRSSIDDGPVYVDIADTLEVILQADKEELIDAVLLFLEHEHHISARDLTTDQCELLQELIKITKGEI